ncbi:MAG: hypothetical protein JNJ78_18645 [Anaerolineae bacterium]|nr:hypothetical protein [Anaerolineae bacterium]
MASGITSFPITHRNPCLRHPRLFPPDSLSATTTTTTNTPLGGNLGFFPPYFTVTPPPLLLPNPSSKGLVFASVGSSH